MNVIVDVCIVPIGVGVSVSKYIAECEKIFTGAGLIPHLHAYGTVVEGEWDVVFAAVKRCHAHLHEMGVPRISTSARFGTRTDRTQTIESKVQSVQDKM